MAKSPIRQLLDALAKGSPPPFDWMVEHASDGTLQQIWNKSTAGSEMLWLYAYARDERGLTLTTITCLRRVGFTPNTDSKYVGIVKAVEQWAQGRLSKSYLALLRESDWMYRRTPIWDLVFSARADAKGVAAANEVCSRIDAHIRDQMTDKQIADLHRSKESDIAVLVHALLPCPTLEQVLSRD